MFVAARAIKEDLDKTAHSILSPPAETEAMEHIIDESTESNIEDLGQNSKREPRSIDTFLDEAYEDKTHGTKWAYWIAMLSLVLSNSSDSAEVLCVGFLLSDPILQKEMLQAKWHGSLLACSVFVGILTGTLLVGALGDVMGRRPMMRLGLAMIGLLGILSSFSCNIYQLSFLRGLTGLAIGSTTPPMLAMASELAPPSRRGLFVTMVSSGWVVGSVYVTTMAWIIFSPNQHNHSGGSWRWFLIVATFPSIVALLMMSLLLVESPRFQALHQQQEEAAVSLERLAKQMKYSGPPMTIDEILYHYPKTTTTTASSIVSGDDSCSAPRQASSLSQIYKTVVIAFVNFGRSSLKLYHKRLVRTTIPLQIVWIGLGFASNGIAVWITRLFQAVHLSNIYFSALLFAVSQIPGCLLTVVLIDWTTRQRVLSIGFLGSAVSLVVFAYFANTSTSASSSAGSTSLGVVASAFMYHMFIQIAWNTISVVSTERFPTVVRATAYAVLSSSGKISGVVASFVNGFLVSWPVVLLLLASVSMVIAGVTPFALEGIHSRALQDGLTNESQKGIEIGQETAALLGDNEGDTDERRGFSINQREEVSYQSI